MKHLSIFLCLIGLSTHLMASADQQPYSLKGRIKGADKQYIYLVLQGRNQVKDSALIKKGAFSFNGQLLHPVMAVLYLDPEAAMDEKGAASVFLEPGKLSIDLVKDDFGNARLTGSKTQDEYAEMRKLQADEQAKLKPFRDKYQQLSSEYYKAIQDKKDSVTLENYKQKLDDIKEQMMPVSERMQKIEDSFIATHPDSYVSAYLLQFKIGNYTYEKALSLYNALSAPVQQSSYGQSILREAEALKKGSPGNAAHYFTRTDINGEQFNLADYKGRYVLLDFWASWCVPCRAGNPHLIKVYHQYKNRGFEIVGVSDDDDTQDAWKKAVEKDKIGIWKHVLRGYNSKLNGASNPDDLSEMYAIHSLPTKILIDKQGMIIGRYGGNGDTDEALDAKLAEVMPAPTALNLKGNIRGLKDSAVNISWYDETGYKNEQVPVQNGTFSWTKKLVEPQKLFINNSSGYMEFFGENADITIDGSADSFYESKVSGSATQDEYASYRASIKPLLTELYKYQMANHAAKNDAEKALAENRIDSISHLLDLEENKYIAKHPGSIVSLNLVENRGMMGEYDDVNKAYELLSPEAKRSLAGKKISERLEVLKRSTLGTPMKDFTMPSLKGKPVRLSDFKGKYVFVDFWASWCGPCRAENPNVLRAYNKYKNKNFTVLGVSLDDNREKWKAAVEKDKMPWTQISDLKGFDNELSSYYGIMAIPATFLIDPQGRIIAKGLRGARLHARLAEILK